LLTLLKDLKIAYKGLHFWFFSGFLPSKSPKILTNFRSIISPKDLTAQEGYKPSSKDQTD
jgi:hypothetical protein